MIGVVVNPHSRKNRGRTGLKRRIEKMLGAVGHVIETPSVDAIIPALRTFADEGRRYWVADGGDGALHWIVNEAVRYFGPERATEMAVYVPTGGGSIDFVAQSLGLPRDPAVIIRRLAARVQAGDPVREVPVRSIAFAGQQILYGNVPSEFRRIAFGTALAGYGANFFGPLYEEDKSRAPARIASLVAAAFGSAALRAAMRGPLAKLKPAALKRAETAFLRPVHARVYIDGRELRGKKGETVHEHTAIHCASVPLNLANIFRIFPLADGAHLHVHAGYVTAAEMARLLPRAMSSRTFDELLPRGFDGAATSLRIECIDDEMTPVLDGEIFYRMPMLDASLGPVFTMAVP